MKLSRFLFPIAALSLLGSVHGQEIITSGTYTQTFDSIGSGLPSNWSVRTGANATSLGNNGTFVTAQTAWSDTSGKFANYASNNIASSSNATQQNADTDRALGVRQTGSLGDPGAAFAFHFSTEGVDLQQLTFDLMTLNDQARTTTWSIQYGIGDSPTAFTTLSTYITGTFSSTNFNFTLSSNPADLALMSDQSSVWFRVVALTASSGSGSRDITAIDNFKIAATETVVGSELYWNAGSWTSTPIGASGNGNWTDGAGDWVSTSKAMFAFDGPSDITVGTVTASGGIEFSANGYSLTGGTITMGSPIIEVASGVTASIGSTLAGTSGITVVGGGTLGLTGANTFTGNTTISASTLAISADQNLGASTNDILLSGGALSATNSLSLGSSRDITGSGSIFVGAGDTLTINGATNLSLTLSGSGTVVLNGASNTLSNLTFDAPGTLSGNAVTLTGSVSTAYGEGTAVIAASLDLGTTLRSFTITDGTADIDLDVTGNLTSGGTGAARLHKLGAGSLRLAGDNSSLASGVRLGTANGATGGRLIVTNNTSLGTASQFQFNNGTLVAENNVAFNIGASIGGTETAQSVIEGANVTFTGSTNFFPTTGMKSVLKVNNTTTFNGTFTSTNSVGLALGGTGTLIVNADAGNITTANVEVEDSLKLVVNNTWASGLSVGTDATISGVGSILGTLSVAGNLTPGNGTSAGGILTAAAISLDSTATTTMFLNGSSTRGVDYSAIDVTGLLTYGGDLVLNLTGSSYGTPMNLFDFGSIAGAWSSVGLTGTYGIVSLTDSDLDGIWTASTGTVDFAFNAGDGLFTVVPVPEPSTYALLLAGVGLVFWTLRRKRQTA